MEITSILIVAVLIAVLVGILVGVRKVSAKLRKKEFTCSKCQTHCDFDDDVEWTCIREFTKDMGSQHEHRAVVEFTCQCPKCGHVHTFTHTFVTRKYTDDTPTKRGSDIVYNLEDLVKKYYL